MDELWEDGRAIDRPLREAIVIWKDGKVVWVPPEEIEVEDLEADDQGSQGA